MASIFDLLKSGKSKAPRPTIHQFVFIEAPIEVVSREVAAWGEASWWPKDVLWNYVRKTDGEIRVGTKYVIKINKPSAPDWAAEVTQYQPRHLVERTFSKGMFKGREVVVMEERSNGTRIDYELYFTIRGPLNLILWPLVFRSQYMKTIKQILKSFKTNLEQQHRDLLK